MKRDSAPYKLLQALLILAMLVQPVAAAGLSVQLPCEHESVAGQRHAAMAQDTQAKPVRTAAPDSHACCCDHDSACEQASTCMQHCASFLVALLPMTGSETLSAFVTIPWHLQALHLLEAASSEFRPPRNTA